jgi:crotonobetainyl-CoA:carnitine CoA-transferase CaiB-like acyl-CoA transferase
LSAYQGLRVVDFSQGTPAAMAAMMLGDFGAEIVKVAPANVAGADVDPAFLAFDRNKDILEVGIESTVAQDLIAGADVAIFDFTPGAMAKRGLEASSLTDKYPQLVHTWMPHYGTKGILSELPPSHSLLAGLTGTAFFQGAFTDVPVHLVTPVLWYAQAVLGATSIGAALYERSRSGRGQAVEVTGLHGTGFATMPARLSGITSAYRYRPGQNPRYRIYQCSDGQWLFLGALFVPFYRRALRVLGVEDFFEAFEKDQAAAGIRLAELFAARPRAEWLDKLRASDVPCAVVGPREEWLSNDLVTSAGLRETFDHPLLGRVEMPGPTARLSGTPASVRHLPRSIAEAPDWPLRPASAAMAGACRLAAPLAGVRVLNLGAVVAGAYTGPLLAKLGAEVIKVEPPEGDGWRSDNPAFFGINRGTRGIGLDLKQPQAKEIMLELVRNADVVMDNFRPGVRARLGVDYQALRAINPAIITCSVTGYDERGEHAERPVFDPLLQAEAGMMEAQGGCEAPVVQTIPINDVAAASVAVMAVVAALNARDRTGEGQEITTSLMAQSLMFQLGELVNYDGRPANDRGGTDCTGVTAVRRYYACADGWIGVHCMAEADATSLCAALCVETGPNPLAEARDGALAQRLETAFAPRPRAEALAVLLAAGVAAAPAIRQNEMWTDDWLLENRFTECWNQPRLGSIESPRSYGDFSATPGHFLRPGPEIGEHSISVLEDWGIARSRIAELLISGAVFMADGHGSILPRESTPQAV